MTQTGGCKKRKYSLKMQDKYNDLLRVCATEKTVNELSVMFSKSPSHIKHWVESLQINGHMEAEFIHRNLSDSLVWSISKYVPQDQFTEEYRPKSRRTTPEIETYKWAGNPYRETVI